MCTGAFQWYQCQDTVYTAYSGWHALHSIQNRRTKCAISTVCAAEQSDLRVLACSSADIIRDLASQDVLHKELGGVIGCGRGV